MVDKLEQHVWYAYIIYYLMNLTCSSYLVDHKRRSLSLKAYKYYLNQNGLRCKYPKGLVLICVDNQESHKLTVELHMGLCGGHYSTKGYNLQNS